MSPLVVITLQDDEDGKIDVSVQAEPPLSLLDEDESPPVHVLALAMLNAAAERSVDVQVKQP